MFGIKTRLIKRAKKITNQTTLNKLSLFDLFNVSFFFRSELKQEIPAYKISNPTTPKNNFFSKISKITTLGFNPNNLGNWSISKPFNIPTKIEKNVIEIEKKLIKAPSNIIGSFIAGATEGNLFSNWAGNEYLKNKSIKQKEIILIKTDLAHYSISKAAKITNTQTFITEIDSNNWCINVEYLEKNINKLVKNGFRGFIIPLTIGYTISGTTDPIKDVLKTIKKLKQKNKNIEFFVWIDAAYLGSYLPIIDPEFKPFSSNEIQTYVFDFHKVLGVSYPSSLILYKKDLAKLTQFNPSYIDHSDQEILGSRSGISPIETWTTLKGFGRQGIKKIITKQLKNKNLFINKINKRPEVKNVLTNKNSLQAMILVKKPFPKKIENKLNLKINQEKVLTTNGFSTIKYYKIFFLPKY